MFHKNRIAIEKSLDFGKLFVWLHLILRVSIPYIFKSSIYVSPLIEWSSCIVCWVYIFNSSWKVVGQNCLIPLCKNNCADVFDQRGITITIFIKPSVLEKKKKCIKKLEGTAVQWLTPSSHSRKVRFKSHGGQGLYCVGFVCVSVGSFWPHVSRMQFKSSWTGCFRFNLGVNVSEWLSVGPAMSWRLQAVPRLRQLCNLVTEDQL